MGYCTVQDIIDRVPTAARDVSPNVLSRFIDEATSVIESVLRGRYIIPLRTPIPPDIRLLCISIVKREVLALYDDSYNEEDISRLDESNKSVLDEYRKGFRRLPSEYVLPTSSVTNKVSVKVVSSTGWLPNDPLV